MVTQHSAMKFQILVLILLLARMYPSVAQCFSGYCCLMYTGRLKKGTKRHIVSYRVQETEGGCDIPAIVFKLKSSKTICADPKQSWVQELMQKIDNKNTGT